MCKPASKLTPEEKIERRRIACKKFYDNHKEVHADYHKTYYAQNKALYHDRYINKREERRLYYIDNRDKILAKSKARYEAAKCPETFVQKVQEHNTNPVNVKFI